MLPNNYSFLQFNNLLQSGNRVGILVNSGIRITLILFYPRITFTFSDGVILFLIYHYLYLSISIYPCLFISIFPFQSSISKMFKCIFFRVKRRKFALFTKTELFSSLINLSFGSSFNIKIYLIYLSIYLDSRFENG